MSEHKIPGKKSINSPMEDKSIILLWSKETQNNDQAVRRSFARNSVGISISYYWIYPRYVSGGLQDKAGVQVELRRNKLKGEIQYSRTNLAIESFLSTTFCKDLWFQMRSVPFPAANIALTLLERPVLESPGLVKLQGYLRQWLRSLTENWQSTGSRRCSKRNSINFPKWRKTSS